MTLGEKLLKMRKARGWSQEDLAEKLGVSRQAVSRWEAGTAKPDADKIIWLCDLFGVSADYLLREDYSGERTVISEKQPPRKWNVGKILLGLYAVLSGGGLFVLKLLSSIYPKPYYRQFYRDGKKVTQFIPTGFLTYIIHYNLEWLLVLLLIGIGGGLVLIWQGSPRLREKASSVRKKLRGLIRKR